jgi:predicted GH43/DUF377 family glycosyl hydrolase
MIHHGDKASKDFVLEPSELWECGDVPNVVFSCANPVVNGTVYILRVVDHVIGLPPAR